MPARPTSISVTGVIQHYAWGDERFIPDLLGCEPDGRPWAELWLGTHPNGPTTVDGEPLEARTGPLPYLVKVLAAAEPLSLQAHPNSEQAADGFARGIYPDDRAKPELIVALTPLDALCGLRPPDATLQLLDGIGARDLAASLRSNGLVPTIEAIYRRHFDIGSTIAACHTSNGREALLVRRLTELYPDDPSVAVTLLLNRVAIRPGQALHLTAGNLHAYLGGAGIELMAASDNVVRGGLTEKHVDVDELLRVLDPAPLAQPVMSVTDGRYPLPEAGCVLVRLDIGRSHTSTGHELAIGLDGSTSYLPPGSTLVTRAVTFVVTTL